MAALLFAACSRPVEPTAGPCAVHVPVGPIAGVVLVVFYHECPTTAALDSAFGAGHYWVTR